MKPATTSVRKPPLFGKSLRNNFYNYCPSLLVEDGLIHVWYCTNKDSGNITDHIGYRTAPYQEKPWRFSRERIVLSPDPHTWDSRHACDPSVIKGTFSYQGEMYSYLMSYLGCVTDDCTDNEAGLALAKKPSGPWVKWRQNPVACFTNSIERPAPHQYWGYGQPTVLSVDKKGLVALFYNVGAKESYTKLELWDFTDMDHPAKIRETRIQNDGYINIEGRQDIVANADFAYDAKQGLLYAVSDMRVRGNGEPSYISAALPLLCTRLRPDEEYPLATLFQGGYHWDVVGVIDPSASGFARNHNPGILTDEYGWTLPDNPVFIAYTVSDENRMHPHRKGIWPSLHTYRIYGKTFPAQKR